MATPAEKLAESLKVLQTIQKNGIVAIKLEKTVKLTTTFQSKLTIDFDAN